MLMDDYLDHPFLDFAVKVKDLYCAIHNYTLVDGAEYELESQYLDFEYALPHGVDFSGNEEVGFDMCYHELHISRPFFTQPKKIFNAWIEERCTRHNDKTDRDFWLKYDDLIEMYRTEVELLECLAHGNPCRLPGIVTPRFP